MDDGKFIRWNEEMFAKYGNDRLYCHPNPLIRYIENRRVAEIVRIVGNAPAVLEVGCGEGHVLGQLRAKEKFGVDISRRALELAGKRTNAKLALADAQRLPFPDSCFDAVVCTEVLEHTLNPKKVIGECARVAKGKGAIALSIPNERRINQMKDVVGKLGLFWLFPGIPRRMDSEWHLHSFDLSHLMGLLDKRQVRSIKSIPPFLSLRYVVGLEGKGSRSSAISFACPDCRAPLSTREENREKKLSCKKCGRAFKDSAGFAELLPKGFL